jgi:flagellin
VDIGLAQFGGAISGTTTSNLKNVNNADYGSGMAKSIADRINNIREMAITDTNAGASGTYLQDVYASAKTTFQSSDMVAADYSGTTVAASNYAYVGAGSIKNGDLNINGVDIGAATFESKDADGSLVTAINAKSDTTGVEASTNDNGELVLTADDGRDIVINTATSTTANLLFSAGGSTQTTGAADFGANLDNLRVTGEVTVTAKDTITMAEANSDEFGVGASQASLEEKNVQAKGTIANADVSTVDGANTLIGSVDSALKQVDDMRAKLGAIQNRFDSTISNLQSVAENLSASRSRTLDADFSQETSNLTKAQILQQAGVAMLAQANQLPQAALSLLK